MAVDKDYSRLGLFIIVVLVVVVGTVFFFVQRFRDRPVVLAATYTSENITGLDVASMVRFKGVAVGRVDGIRVDPASRLVEIDFQLFLDRMANLGADLEEVQRVSDIGVIDDFRVSVVGNPVTGEAHLLIDTPTDPPPPMVLGFEPDRLYIPSMRSSFAGVVTGLPTLIERGEALLVKVEQLVDRLPETLDRTDRFFANSDRILLESDLPALSDEARNFFATTSAEMKRLTDGLAPLLAEDGTLTKFLTAMDEAQLPAASATMLDETSLTLHDLRRSLPAIRDGLEQLRVVTRLLEEQPESILYGPRRR